MAAYFLFQTFIVSGDTGYGEAFCGAGKAIADKYGSEDLYHFENDGNDEDSKPSLI